MPSWAINSTKLSNYIKLNKMEETSKNNETAQLDIGGVITRLFVFGLMWIGIFHLYTTIIDTDWYVWADILASFSAAWLPLYNKGFKRWFLNGL
jgi:hypothetical protein